MSSLPTPSYLSVTPNGNYERSHRHRRSQAISGDFDAMGLGLFSPSNQFNNNLHSYSRSVSSTNQKKINHKEKDPDKHKDFEDIDKYYNFNNDEDFSQKDQQFSFPNKPEGKNSFDPVKDNMSISTPPRNFQYYSNNNNSFNSFSNSPTNKKLNLNSPIKLNSKKSGNNLSRNKFFLTEETNINNENIPDALIDLDEVLNANLHIGNNNDYLHSNNSINSDDEFLASPFLKPTASPYVFSPSISLPNSNSNTLFQQPIQETINDDIEVSEDDRNDNDDEHEEQIKHTTIIHTTNDKSDNKFDKVNDDDEIFNPPNIPDLYSNSSANSSSSSLKHKSIEKTFSNSSNYSNASSNQLVSQHYQNYQVSNNLNDTPKRSGAKANRYKSFYDQTYKISTALKVSSSDSINLIKPNSPNQSYQQLNHQISSPSPIQASHSGNSISSGPAGHLKKFNDHRMLAHSSSLPSLKSSSRQLPKFHRYGGDSRLKYTEINKLSPPPSIVSTNSIQSGNSLQSLSTSATAHSNTTVSTSGTPNYGNNINNNPIVTNANISFQNNNNRTNNFISTPQKSLAKFHNKENKIEISSPSSLKQISNSPISIISDAGSTVLSTNGTIQSTDHSSISHDQPPFTNPSTNNGNNNINFSPPSIIINTDEKEDAEIETIQNSPNLSLKNVSSKNNSSNSILKKTTRRPLTPNESKILKETKIPPFKKPVKNNSKNNSSSSINSIKDNKSLKDTFQDLPPPSKVQTHTLLSSSGMSSGKKKFSHRKSKSFSFSLNELSPKLSKNSNFDDTSSIKSSKSTRLLSWFRKR